MSFPSFDPEKLSLDDANARLAAVFGNTVENPNTIQREDLC